MITIKAGESVGTVVVDTPANDVYNNGSTVTTTITGATGGNFENLVPSTTPAVTTIVDSIDTTTVTLTAGETVTEGGQITYTATLTNPAQTPVTVTLSNGSVITIKAGESVGTVVVIRRLTTSTTTVRPSRPPLPVRPAVTLKIWYRALRLRSPRLRTRSTPPRSR